jgi:hypothetical protein
MFQRVLLLGSILLFQSDAAFAQKTVVALKNEDKPGIEDITGYHSTQDKTDNLELRVLEVDTSVDVARNPVVLFLVITDNGPGNDAQTHIWRLPMEVSEVTSLIAAQSVLKIFAVVDGVMDEKTGRFPTRKETINVTYSMPKGKLSNRIAVAASSP